MPGVEVRVGGRRFPFGVDVWIRLPFYNPIYNSVIERKKGKS
jgi:hypothetical protein